MDTLFGLPAHPLLVHIPIVLLPLAAIGVVVMAIRASWHRRYRWVVLGMGAAGALGTILAAQAGEELERRIIGVEGAEAASSWERHTGLGETARNVAIVFLVVLVAFVFLPWWNERRSLAPDASGSATPPAASRNIRIATVVMSALAILASIGTVVTVIRAGHTGSKSVWEDYVRDTGADSPAP